MFKVKRILVVIFTLLLLLFLGLAAYVISAPDIPANSDEIIENGLTLNTLEFYNGEGHIAKNGDIELWYEYNEATSPKKGTILLVTGYGCTSIQWPSYFFKPFLNAGYDVIRYDHRDVGLSSWIKDWDKWKPYNLEDMADDAVSILDDAGVDKAHVIGISMGGMISQCMAINHRERILSMTSMSSTAFFDDKDLPGIFPATFRAIARYSAKYRFSKSLEAQIKSSLTASNLFKGKYDLDNTYTVQKVRYEHEKRNGFNPEAPIHHGAAINASGSRYDALSNIKLPTLIIHGRVDPLVNFEHGVKMAELMPDAKTLYIDDLGHDIPIEYSNQMVDAILNLLAHTDNAGEELTGI